MVRAMPTEVVCPTRVSDDALMRRAATSGSSLNGRSPSASLRETSTFAFELADRNVELEAFGDQVFQFSAFDELDAAVVGGEVVGCFA